MKPAMSPIAIIERGDRMLELSTIPAPPEDEGETLIIVESATFEVLRPWPRSFRDVQRGY